MPEITAWENNPSHATTNTEPSSEVCCVGGTESKLRSQNWKCNNHRRILLSFQTFTKNTLHDQELCHRPQQFSPVRWQIIQKSSHSRYKSLTLKKIPSFCFRVQLWILNWFQLVTSTSTKKIQRVTLLHSTLIIQSRENLRFRIINHRIHLKSQELLSARLNTIKFHSFDATV
jgi:hypothetical protein